MRYDLKIVLHPSGNGHDRWDHVGTFEDIETITNFCRSQLAMGRRVRIEVRLDREGCRT